MLKLQCQDLLKGCRSKDFEWFDASVQMKTGQQAYQPKIMITMEVTDEYKIYFAGLKAIFDQLLLGTFPAVDQVKLLVTI
jgi:hypothetical protein